MIRPDLHSLVADQTTFFTFHLLQTHFLRDGIFEYLSWGWSVYWYLGFLMITCVSPVVSHHPDKKETVLEVENYLMLRPKISSQNYFLARRKNKKFAHCKCTFLSGNELHAWNDAAEKEGGEGWPWRNVTLKQLFHHQQQQPGRSSSRSTILNNLVATIAQWEHFGVWFPCINYSLCYFFVTFPNIECGREYDHAKICLCIWFSVQTPT